MMVEYRDSRNTFLQFKDGIPASWGCCEDIKNCDREYFDIIIPAYSSYIDYKERGTTLVKYINLIKNLGFDVEYRGLLTNKIKTDNTKYYKEIQNNYSNTLRKLSAKYNYKCDLVNILESNNYILKYLSEPYTNIKIDFRGSYFNIDSIPLYLSENYGHTNCRIDGFKFSGSNLTIEEEIKSIYNYDKDKYLTDNFYTIRVYSGKMIPISRLAALTLIRYFWKNPIIVENILKLKKEGISDFYSFMIVELYTKLSGIGTNGYGMIQKHNFTTENKFRSDFKDVNTSKIYNVFNQSLSAFNNEKQYFIDMFKENKFKELETFLKNHK